MSIGSSEGPRLSRYLPYLPRAGAAAGAAICALLFFILPATAVQQGHVVHEVRSQYQLITVVDTPDGYRQLIFDGRFDGSDAIQSQVDLSNRDALTLSYARHMMTVPPVAAAAQRILVVGLGGACLQRYLHRLLPGAVVETVEIDPEVRRVAAEYFFLREDARQVVHIADGRKFIEQAKNKYDIILLDAFTAEEIPYHLTTREFLQAVRDRLTEGGVAAANLWDGEPGYWDMVRTYADVFPELHIVKCSGARNSIVVALPVKSGLTVEKWAEKAAAFDKAHPTGLDLPDLVRRGARGADIPSTARVLTDKGN